MCTPISYILFNRKTSPAKLYAIKDPVFRQSALTKGLKFCTHKGQNIFFKLLTNLGQICFNFNLGLNSTNKGDQLDILCMVVLPQGEKPIRCHLVDTYSQIL